MANLPVLTKRPLSLIRPTPNQHRQYNHIRTFNCKYLTPNQPRIGKGYMILEPGRPFYARLLLHPKSGFGERLPVNYKMETRPYSTAGSLKFTHDFGLNCFFTFREQSILQDSVTHSISAPLLLSLASDVLRRLLPEINYAERSGDRNRPADRSGLSKAPELIFSPKSAA
jgi:hypothetical protein